MLLDMQTYTGGCHCGAVRFEATTDLSSVISCNCSHCGIKALLLTFVPAESFTLLAGEDTLTEYRFNKNVIEHRFCSICGVQPFGRAEGPDGALTVAVNVRCFDTIDLDALTITPYNGKDI